jgi:hypothetical protein
MVADPVGRGCVRRWRGCAVCEPSLGRDQTAGFDAKTALPGTRRLRYEMGVYRVFLALSLLVLSAQAARADESLLPGLIREPTFVSITLPDGAQERLEAPIVRQDRPGRFPLVLMVHGTPRDSTRRSHMSPAAYIGPAVAFASRGYAVVSIMRRGFGRSDGTYAEEYGGGDTCGNRDYLRVARISAEDCFGRCCRLACRGLGRRGPNSVARSIDGRLGGHRGRRSEPAGCRRHPRFRGRPRFRCAGPRLRRRSPRRGLRRIRQDRTCAGALGIRRKRSSFRQRKRHWRPKRRTGVSPARRCTPIMLSGRKRLAPSRRSTWPGEADTAVEAGWSSRNYRILTPSGLGRERTGRRRAARQ